MSLAAKLTIADGLIVMLAIIGVLNAVHETNRSIVKRWRLLVTGLAAAAADLVLIAYPSPRDLLQVELWMVAALALLAGLARGALLALFSDHKWGQIRMRRTFDGVIVAVVLLLFATVQAVTEFRAGTGTKLGVTMELVMTVLAGYLLGRAISGWLRAGMIQHEDLNEPIL